MYGELQRPPWRPRARAAISPAWVRSLISAASYSAHQGERAEDEFAVRGGGVHPMHLDHVRDKG